jgi:hypothetical protein
MATHIHGPHLQIGRKKRKQMEAKSLDVIWVLFANIAMKTNIFCLVFFNKLG